MYAIDKDKLVQIFTIWAKQLVQKYWKKMFKKLNVYIIPILKSWDDRAFMTISPRIQRHGVKNTIFFNIYINIEKFSKDFINKLETGDIKPEEFMNFAAYQFQRILLHELRHAAQDKYIFNRLHKNRRAFIRYKRWEHEKYAPNLNNSLIERDAYDYQDYGSYGQDIFRNLDFLNKEIAEFLNK